MVSPVSDVRRMLARYDVRGVPRLHSIRHAIRTLRGQGMGHARHGALMIEELLRLERIEQRKREQQWASV